MSKFLYADFLENKRAYNLAQGSWNRLLTSLLKDYEYTHTPYINQTQNGEKEYDGNPIFSAFIPEIKRAIRIIQTAPKEEGDDISAWVDNIELNAKQEKTAELVLDIKLSQTSKRIAKELLRQWISKELDASALEEVLAGGAVV